MRIFVSHLSMTLLNYHASSDVSIYLLIIGYKRFTLHIVKVYCVLTFRHCIYLMFATKV